MGYRTRGRVTLTLFPNSQWIIDGKVNISQGASILIGSGAVLKMGNNVTIGDNSEVICYKSIEIGNNVRIPWEIYISDFKTHSVLDMNTNRVSNLYAPIKIGDNSWIGNRSTIQPGTILPERTIVASNSLLNKNYIEKGIKPYSLLAGQPARLVKENVMRDFENDLKIKSYFSNHNVEYITLDQIRSL